MSFDDILTLSDLLHAKDRIKQIGAEIEDLEDEVSRLYSERDRLQDEIERFEKKIAMGKADVAGQLWRHVQEFWNRFTWTESRIAERAAKGEELEHDETLRLKLLCMQELGVIL